MLPLLTINRLISIFSLHSQVWRYSQNATPPVSGLRIQHLLDGISAPAGDRLLSSLATFVNAAINGRLHLSSQPFLCGARLIALCKNDDDVRPIAVGEILRRLAAKSLLLLYPESIGPEVVGEHQFGHASLGAERIVHRIRSTQANPPPIDHDVVLVDFANAFNNISRQAFLSRVSQVAPHLAAFASFCYGYPSTLLFFFFFFGANKKILSGLFSFLSLASFSALVLQTSRLNVNAPPPAPLRQKDLSCRIDSAISTTLMEGMNMRNRALFRLAVVPPPPSAQLLASAYLRPLRLSSGWDGAARNNRTWEEPRSHGVEIHRRQILFHRPPRNRVWSRLSPSPLFDQRMSSSPISTWVQALLSISP
jgi:hypothetical protein